MSMAVFFDEVSDDEFDEYIDLCDRLRGHRWPYGPLSDVLGGSPRAQSARLGVHDRQVYRWRSNGLTDAMADRLALRAGLHPAMVWDGWHDITDLEASGILEEVA